MKIKSYFKLYLTRTVNSDINMGLPKLGFTQHGELLTPQTPRRDLRMFSLLRRLLRGFSGVDTFTVFLQLLSVIPSIHAIGIYGQMYCVLQP